MLGKCPVSNTVMPRARCEDSWITLFSVQHFQKLAPGLRTAFSGPTPAPETGSGGHAPYPQDHPRTAKCRSLRQHLAAGFPRAPQTHRMSRHSPSEVPDGAPTQTAHANTVPSLTLTVSSSRGTTANRPHTAVTSTGKWTLALLSGEAVLSKAPATPSSNVCSSAPDSRCCWLVTLRGAGSQQGPTMKGHRRPRARSPRLTHPGRVLRAPSPEQQPLSRRPRKGDRGAPAGAPAGRGSWPGPRLGLPYSLCTESRRVTLTPARKSP